MSIQKIDTARIPVWALPALINGDTSDLHSAEESLLEDFINGYEADGCYGFVFETQGEPYFSKANDVDRTMAGEVYDVDIYAHQEEV
jgi:hypothetical protein